MPDQVPPEELQRLHERLDAARQQQERLRDKLKSSETANAELRGRMRETVEWASELRAAREAAVKEQERLLDRLRQTQVPAGMRQLAEARPGRTPGGAVLRLASARNVIEVEGLCKSFRVPADPAGPRKRSLRHPFGGVGHTNLEVLRDVSFEVRQGEFLGLVGANGAGKSTLLKLIAGSYRADAGRIRVAGPLAALIELGVGFHPELTAYDNVLFNGVLLGLSPEQVDARYDEIIEFAGLKGFTELKARNYSNGMRVRLGFSVMMQVDADIYLVDEALAVGDPAFQERCFDLLAERRREGKTIVLVSQSMPKVMKQCERAILLHGARLVATGDPEQVAERYAELIHLHGDVHQEPGAVGSEKTA